jgi:2-polyprenyl-6-hydroxyphenyl methylase/3-demethylubiquinone-9 3-methyltransferase
MENDTETLYAYKYHDYASPDPPHQPLYLEVIEHFLKQDPSTVHVLDAGCGDGNFTESLRVGGFQMYGIDLTRGGIAAAEKAYPGCKFQVASVYDDFTKLFSERSRFDAVVSIEVIEHLYSPRLFVRNAWAALRPGGLFIVTTPYWGYLKNIALAVTDRLDRALTALWDGGHIKHWSHRTLKRLLIENHFEFVDFHGSGRRVPYLERNAHGSQESGELTWSRAVPSAMIACTVRTRYRPHNRGYNSEIVKGGVPRSCH